MTDSYLFWKRFDEAKPVSMSLKDLCASLGLAYQRIADQRSDCRLPKLDDAFNLANRIGVSLEYLLTGNEQKTHSPRVARIAEACEVASDLELSMVEKILDIPIAGKNTDIQMTS